MILRDPAAFVPQRATASPHTLNQQFMFRPLACELVNLWRPALMIAVDMSVSGPYSGVRQTNLPIHCPVSLDLMYRRLNLPSAAYPIRGAYPNVSVHVILTGYRRFML